jgi:ribosomal protein S18 acetylase RimI-like enzyme
MNPAELVQIPARAEMKNPPVPVSPRMMINIREGRPSDVYFLDRLQRKHTREVGWMPTKQFEGKIKLGHVLIAESAGRPIGYLIGNDRYFKRDDVGVIYQINVDPEFRRHLVAGSLLKAQFERSAYGCRLYCCWCAQDIAANRFWESMGFVPLAYRAGSEKKGRVHIFWQKRIVMGDTTTPWWFPSQTSGGSIREDRIVLPIPPGEHWSEVKSIILPGLQLEGPKDAGAGPTHDASKEQLAKRVKRPKRQPIPLPERRNGLWFEIPLPEPKEPAAGTEGAGEAGRAVKKKPAREKPKIDPQLVAVARELRDRWLERVNAGEFVPESAGCHEPARELDRTKVKTPTLIEQATPRLIEAA